MSDPDDYAADIEAHDTEALDADLYLADLQ